MLKHTLVGLSALAVLATAGCGGGGDKGPSATAATRVPVTVGEFAAGPGPVGGQSRDAIPLAEGQQLVPCAQAARLAGDKPLVVAAPASAPGQPSCLVNRPGGTPPGAAIVTVAYIPDGLSPDVASAQDVTEHGGLLVTTTWGLPDAPTPPESPSAARVDVNGHPGVVMRLTDTWVVVEFSQGAADGRRQTVVVRGNDTPDKLVGVARSLRRGDPANERPVPGAAPTTTTPNAPTTTAPPTPASTSTSTSTSTTSTTTAASTSTTEAAEPTTAP